MKKFKFLSSVFTIIGVMVFGSLAMVAAQQDQGSTGSGLIISPTRTELEITPGGSGVVSITLQNVSGGDIVAEANVNDFLSDDETGTPKILPITDELQPSSIKDFITNLNDVELTESERKDIELNISIPAGTPAGAYYGVVRYTAVPKDSNFTEEERQIALSASLGSLVLITVPGEISEQIQVERVEIRETGNPGTFFFNAPNEAAITIKNNGNGFAKPFGRITLNQGSTEVYSYELNSSTPRANILPDSRRTFVDSIEGVSSPGRYTLVSNISQGDGGEVITQQVSFWYIPIWLIATGVGLLVALFIAGYVVYRRKFASRKRR